MILDVTSLDGESKSINETMLKIKAMKQIAHNFEEDCEKCRKSVDRYSKEPLIVGRYEDYSKADLENTNFSILVHENLVYITCQNSWLHEGISRGIGADIDNSLFDTFGNIFYNVGSATLNLFNYHGCCSTFGKEPDFCFGVVPAFRKKQRYPAIVGDIAVTHENQHMLFVEAMIYLNSFTDIRYCILVDVLPREAFLYARIVVCERTLKSSNLNKKEREKFISEKKALKRRRRKFGAADADSDACKKIKDKSSSNDRAEIENNYHFKIVFDHTVRLTSEGEIILQDLVFYLHRDLLVEHLRIDTASIPELIPVRVTTRTLNNMAAEFHEAGTSPDDE